jgi:hypothetical protein
VGREVGGLLILTQDLGSSLTARGQLGHFWFPRQPLGTFQPVSKDTTISSLTSRPWQVHRCTAQRQISHLEQCQNFYRH